MLAFASCVFIPFKSKFAPAFKSNTHIPANDAKSNLPHGIVPA